MNKIDLQQTGGFPLETDTLDAMQTAYSIFNSLGNIVAPLSIISGCTPSGNIILNGTVYINGEILEFRGGTPTQYVTIREDVTKRFFEGGIEEKTVYRTRYATFGESATNENYKWSDFHRPFSLKEIGNRLVHPGFIQDYYGDINQIPFGWVVCDGTNGTPDLRGMFIVGYDDRNADYNAIGKTGGAKEVTLTTEQMAKHNHEASVSSGGGHSHQMFANSTDKSDDISSSQQVANKGRKESGSAFQFVIQQNKQGYEPTLGRTSENGSHSHDVSISEVGGNQPHENRPPYYVLTKIMYKG